MATNDEKKPKREIYERPEEKDLRVLAVVSGIDRLRKANLLTPYELAIALKLALSAMVRENRAPMATIHQFRGFLLDIEAEVGGDLAESDGSDLSDGSDVSEGKEAAR